MPIAPFSSIILVLIRWHRIDREVDSLWHLIVYRSTLQFCKFAAIVLALN